MSAPFGGHPKLGTYLEWARNEHNFRVQTGFAPDGTGKAHTVTKVYKDGGPSAFIVGTAQDEYLVPTMVNYLDRRLEITSPFFSIDDSNYTPS
ncbi:hypothetical protein ACFQ14_10750 [Pseudahrensia aquimaris]|uniref:Uncharacterized protein n=1 Tax=Pseudahrensia aquimaris TaxID=744461 RepID=A0ABW3FFD7_9HYPH